MKLVIVIVCVTAMAMAKDSKEFKMKVKNTMAGRDLDEDIILDREKGTEVIKVDGETSMKDFKTGYTAIKSEKDKTCLIFENRDAREQKTVEEVAEVLENIKKSGRPAEVVEQAMIGIKTRTYITPEERVKIGSTLMEFCGDANLVFAVPPGQDGGDQMGDNGALEEQVNNGNDASGEPEENERGSKKEADNEILSRRKRATCCTWRLYRHYFCTYYHYLYNYCHPYYYYIYDCYGC